MRKASIIIAGGGTGGHVTPALAIAAATRNYQSEDNRSIDVHFIGTENGIEKRMVPAAGWTIDLLPAKKIKGQSKLRRLLAIASLLPNTWRALGILSQKRATVVIGVGGYASVPAILAAAIRRIPIIIIEQNAIPGLANRYLSKLARVVVTNYPCINNSAKNRPDNPRYFNPKKIQQLGNPVRPEILATFGDKITDKALIEPQVSTSSKASLTKKTLLILGGSQGARAINNLIKTCAQSLLQTHPSLRIIHQCGRADFEGLATHYNQKNIAVDLRAFIDDMPTVYRETDLIVSRAGATTISELAIVGKATILIPLPSAADNHQWHNAAAYADKNAAILVNQNDLDATTIGQMISDYLLNDAKRDKLAENMRQMAKPNAAADIAALATNI